jgi:hypothetical protein
MYANYDLALAPAGVRTRIYPNGNSGVPISHLLVVRQANDPADAAGSIQGYHRVVRYQPSLVANSPFDDIAFGTQRPVTLVAVHACTQHALTYAGQSLARSLITTHATSSNR